MKSIIGKQIDYSKVKHYIQYSIDNLCDEERLYLSNILDNEFIYTANGIKIEIYGSLKFKASFTNELNQIDVRCILK